MSSRLTTLLAIVAVALVAAVPAIAHKNDGSSSLKAVGTVVSYADGTLVISSGGLPVTGRVTRFTKIRWDRRHHGHHRGDDRGHEARSSRRGEHGDDDRGRGEDDGPGHHLGDDHRHSATGGGMPTGGGLPTSGGMPPASSGLVPGAVVRKAELELTKRGPVWEEVRLAVPSAS